MRSRGSRREAESHGRNSGVLGVVRAPLRAEHLADLADRAAGAQRLPHRREQVLVGAGHTPHLGQRRLRGRGVPLGPDACRPLELAPLDLGVEAVELDLLLLVLHELVHADDDPLALLDLLRVAVGRLLDLRLDEALLDRGDRAAALLDPVDQLERPRLELAVSSSRK